MDYKQAKDIIRQRISCKQYLTKSKSGLYVCPFCGSGEGANHTGALKLYDTNTWTCHACNESGDVIDLYRQQTGAAFTDAIKDLAQQAGITEPITGRSTAAEDFAEPAEEPSFNGLVVHEATPLAAAPAADYTAYYESCQKMLTACPEAEAYLQRRGIDLATALVCGLGYDPQADPAAAPGGNGEIKHPCPRIIIPTGPAHYVGRSIDPNTPAAFAKMNNKGGKPGIFNESALYAGFDTVFVTEGAFDALSVWEAGKAAIALNSAGNADLLLKQLEQRPTAATLILCLDADDAGRKATEKLKEGLRRLNICYIPADITCGSKDPNDALTANRAAFEQAIAKAAAQTAARPDNTAAYIDALMAGEIERFKQAKNRQTGFSNIDAKMPGAYPGLYTLAAISSLGKTTLALQMADQFAAAGHEVLFFSMEQSRLEMVSKSLARLTAQADMKTAVNSLSIRQGNLPAQVLDAVKQYKATIGERLSIIEGNFNCDIGYIGDYIRRYIARNQTKPIIFIDYLQILQPAADGKSRNSKKDEIDLAVTELKRLSRELDLTIVVISSLNRANYMTPFAFESLKESGGIEYTSDVVWGLQLACLDEEIFDKESGIAKKRERINAAKEENPRKIKFVCLKNRYGISHYECNFIYYPEFDLFVPAFEPATPLKRGGIPAQGRVK